MELFVSLYQGHTAYLVNKLVYLQLQGPELCQSLRNTQDLAVNDAAAQQQVDVESISRGLAAKPFHKLAHRNSGSLAKR